MGLALYHRLKVLAIFYLLAGSLVAQDYYFTGTFNSHARVCYAGEGICEMEQKGFAPSCERFSDVDQTPDGRVFFWIADWADVGLFELDPPTHTFTKACPWVVTYESLLGIDDSTLFATNDSQLMAIHLNTCMYQPLAVIGHKAMDMINFWNTLYLVDDANELVQVTLNAAMDDVLSVTELGTIPSPDSIFGLSKLWESGVADQDTLLAFAGEGIYKLSISTLQVSPHCIPLPGVDFVFWGASSRMSSEFIQGLSEAGGPNGAAVVSMEDNVIALSSTTEMRSVLLMDAIGRIISATTPGSRDALIRTSDLGTGLYLLRAELEDGSVFAKSLFLAR